MIDRNHKLSLSRQAIIPQHQPGQFILHAATDLGL